MDVEEFLEGIGRPAWMTQARCRGLLHIFGNADRYEEAKAVCNGADGKDPCPVREQCLQYALDRHEAQLVWGGTSERERRKIRRQRKYLSADGS